MLERIEKPERNLSNPGMPVRAHLFARIDTADSRCWLKNHWKHTLKPFFYRASEQENIICSRKVLTAKRWELLKALCGAGPISIREAARRVSRDIKGVHGDVAALLAAGLLNRTESGAIEFPYEAIKVEFMLQAA